MTRPAGHRPAEKDAIRAVVTRLSRQFPELPTVEVERAVYGKYSQFEHSPVREFVPVLVEQTIRRRLSRQAGGRHRA